MAERDRITPPQLMIFIASAQIGFGIWTFSANLAKEIGHDGWISILLGGLVLSFFTVMAMLLLKRYGNRSILEINRLLFGKIAGTCFNLLIFLYLILFITFEIRAFTEFTKLFLLPFTPPLFLAIALILPTIYLTWNGLQAVCRFSQIVFVLFTLTILLTLMLRRELHLSFLQPLGAAGFPKIVTGTALTTFLFLGPELVILIYPLLTVKTQALRWALSANGFTTIFYTLIFVISITVFGEKLVPNLKIPLFNIPSFLPVDGSERRDYIFVIFWFPLLESALRIFFYTGYYTFNELFHLPRNGWLYLLFILLLLLLNLLPRDINQLFAFSTLLSYWGLGILIWVVFCYLISFIRRKGIDNN